ncbi:3-hydroxyacyl-CoA dehydrogenase [Azospirillum soli]|nr:3-hydroxyacyl-CoA dehydrogenase [Azospirillum soli]
MRVGVIGVGTMGRPMAGHLLAAGHTLFVHDIASPPAELLDQGVIACASGREVAQQSEVVLIMVPDAPHAEAVLFGPDGVAEGLARPDAAAGPDREETKGTAGVEPDEDIRSLGYVLRLMAGSCDEPQPA